MTFDSGEYKMWNANRLNPRWVYYEWRISDDVLEVKNKEDPTEEWSVICNFPAAAILCDTD